MIIMHTVSVNTVTIGNIELSNLSIFTDQATLHIKKKPKFIENQIKI